VETLSACTAQAELVERLGAPLEQVLNEHQLRCAALAEQGAFAALRPASLTSSSCIVV